MINVNLVGNPNTGKTTLFNSLTGAHEHVGNWHGVTVEEKARIYKYNGQEIRIVDLPGIYSLTALSYEEKVAVDYILSHKDTIVVNICDANNLQRNLYLTLGLMELGVPIVLAVNQIDKRKSCKIDFKKFEELLNVKVVYLNAGDKKEVKKLNDAIIELNNKLKNNYIVKYNIDYFDKIKKNNEKFNKLDKIIDKNIVKSKDLLFYKIKILEDDENIKSLFNIKNNFDCVEEVAICRYSKIEEIIKSCVSASGKVYGQSKLDSIFLNRFLALPIFLLLLAGCFYLTFFSIGSYLSDGLDYLLQKFIASPLINLLSHNFGSESFVVSLFQEAIIGGVGSILTFLPQVALLFFFLSLLEDSGYLSRVAFVFEDVLGKVGLSGKSVYTLLMGFGCSATAVLTARNMEDKNSKIKTGLLTPYMSCSAKFPIYAVLGGAFFGANNIFVIIGLYLLGVVIAVALSYVLEKTVLKSKEQSFILEFPPYRMMSFKRTFEMLWLNVKLFITRVGTLILAMNIVVWILSNFTFTLKFVGVGEGVSILETIGKILSPMFIPLGFNSWGLASALIAGLVAKEIIVSSIAMFNGVEEASIESIQSSIVLSTSAVYFSSPSSVISFLVFCLLYFPCIATTSVLLKEIGKKWTFIGILIEFLIAYLTAFFIYTLGRCFEVFGFTKVLLVISLILILILSIRRIYKVFKKKKFCPYQDKCGRCK